MKYRIFIPCLLLLLFAAHASARDGANDRIMIRKINISGNRITKANIILRELSIHEGEVIAADSMVQLIEKNKKRLFNLSLFTDVLIKPDTISAGEINWNIHVREQWYIIPELSFKLADRNFNVWWKEQHHDIRRANLGVSIKDRNFRGNMEQLSVTGQIGYTQKLGIEYFKPYVDKAQKHGLGGSFSFSQNEETYYTTDSNKLKFIRSPGHYILRQFDAALLYVFRPGYNTRHLIEARYKDFKAGDTIVKLNPGYYLNGVNELKLIELSYRFEYNNVDNWNYPLKGFKTVGYTCMRAGLKGFNFQAYSMWEVSQFERLHNKWYASHVFRGRLTMPEKQPYIYRYAMGGESEYIRGYEYYVIDGSQYGLLRNSLKYELLNISIRNLPLRYLPVIPLKIYPKVYADVGYVRNAYPGNSFLNNRTLYSAGVGVDIITAYDMKLRIEYTLNHLGEKGVFLHATSE